MNFERDMTRLCAMFALFALVSLVSMLGAFIDGEHSLGWCFLFMAHLCGFEAGTVYGLVAEERNEDECWAARVREDQP